MTTFFFTGFPGFIGSELLPRVLERAGDATAACLVQRKYAELARQRVVELEATHPATRGRIRIVEGDITEAGLGLLQAEAAELQRDTVELFHLAAIYDLSVGREFAIQVNVEGTRHMLDFAAACPRLQRFQYVSTCYVSGRHPGVFREEDLEKGQTFNNFYEETKYLAEVEVRLRMKLGLPATIYRPAIVVGDSRTGATQKYDGPYFAVQWLLRQPRIAVMPVVGDPQQTELNVVPRDFVVEAIAALSAKPESLGKTYHLADPAPFTVAEMLVELAHATGRRLVRLPLPLKVAKWAIDSVPGVYALMRIPSSAIDYFAHPTRYDTRNTREDLRGTGIHVPPFPEYADALTSFVRQHPEIGSAAMA
jgi:thioester reductase-like protein